MCDSTAETSTWQSVFIPATIPKPPHVQAHGVPRACTADLIYRVTDSPDTPLLPARIVCFQREPLRMLYRFYTQVGTHLRPVQPGKARRLADSALRLEQVLGMQADSWLGL